jgi:hypothetical protein
MDLGDLAPLALALSGHLGRGLTNGGGTYRDLQLGLVFSL